MTAAACAAQNRPAMQQPGSPEALLAAIAQSGNEVDAGLDAADVRRRRRAWLADLQRNSARLARCRRPTSRSRRGCGPALLSGTRRAGRRPRPGDRRFSGKEWRDNPYYDYLQAVLSARLALPRGAGRERAQLEPQAKERARFAARQWIDAMSPGELRRDQSGGAAPGARDAGREPDARPRQPARRRAEGRISQTDEARVRGRPQPRRDARRGGVRERADPADPVPGERPRRSRRGRW